MANVQQSSFAVDAAVGTSFGFTATNIALPGTVAGDSIVRVANLGPCHVAVRLTTSSSDVTVTPSTGIIVLAGGELWLTLGSNTRIEGVASGGPGMASTVNIATGN